MRPRRLTRTRTRPSLAVSVGEWIRIPVQGEPFPVHVRVGNAPERPAFIDHESDGAGGFTAVAAVRCPSLPAGDHPVVVRLPDGNVIETAITIG